MSGRSVLIRNAKVINFINGELGSGVRNDPSNVWPVRDSTTPGIIQIPKTGNTITITPGDDGNLQKGIVWPSPRFVDNSSTDPQNLSAIDNLTGFTWSKDAQTPGPNACGPATTKNWQDALDYVVCLNTNRYLGYSDWRLPNSRELFSLVNCDSPSSAVWLNTQGFSNVQEDDYWSSSSYSYSTAYAWSVHMTYSEIGAYDNKLSNTRYVWPLRGGLGWSLDTWYITGSATFGTRNIGAPPTTQSLTFRNTASVSKSITSVNLTGDNAAEFSIIPAGTSPCASLTPTLAAGASCTMQLIYTPTTVGTKSANLAVIANGSTLDIPITASAIISISGTVYDLSNGTPLAGVQVAINGAAPITATTDSNGYFLFDPALTPDTYTLTFSKNGYGSQTTTGITTTATAGQNLSIGLATGTSGSVVSVVSVPAG
jgi:hypothetical protein